MEIAETVSRALSNKERIFGGEGKYQEKRQIINYDICLRSACQLYYMQ